MLSMSGISVTYGSHRALEDVSVKVAPGEIVVILGANGAGKSSLLRAISGTCEGEVQGTVNLDTSALSGLPPEQIVKQGVAFVPEGRGIFGDMSVEENLMLGAYGKEARLHQDANLQRVHQLFPKLRERASQTTRTMSGGEQQMVAIGRAMMSNPTYLMLDEPSLGLSPLLCKELFQNLSLIRDAGIGVLMVEQNAKQSLSISDRAYLIENGSIVGEGIASDMMNDPAVQAAYLGGASSATSNKATAHSSGPTQTARGLNGTNEVAVSAPVFIKPGGPNMYGESRSQLASIDIGSMVSRASELSVSRHQGTKTAEVSKRSGNKTALVRNNTSIANNALTTDDPDVQSLLADFETAAARVQNDALKGKPKTTWQGNSQVEASDEKLPEIPVFRKSKVEIFRRTPAGDLTKVEKR